MKDQQDAQEQEVKHREARRDRRVEWLKIVATVLDAVSHFLRL